MQGKASRAILTQRLHENRGVEQHHKGWSVVHPYKTLYAWKGGCKEKHPYKGIRSYKSYKERGSVHLPTQVQENEGGGGGGGGRGREREHSMQITTRTLTYCLQSGTSDFREFRQELIRSRRFFSMLL